MIKKVTAKSNLLSLQIIKIPKAKTKIKGEEIHHECTAPKNIETSKMPKLAGLKTCFCLNLIKCFDAIAIIPAMI